MDSKVKRTIKEIDERIAEYKELADNHPESAFGDDNVTSYNWEKNMLDRVKDDTPLFILLAEADDTTDDEEYDNIINLVYWLKGLE